MPNEITREAVVDEEHLKLLSLGYMISAGMSGFFSIIGLFYMAMGAFMAAAFSRLPNNAANAGQPPPAFMGWIFGAVGLGIFLVMLGIGLLKLRAGFCIKRRRGRTFCMIVAGICCLGVPYGTLLGIFTFIVLGRDSVTRVFSQTQAPPA